MSRLERIANAPEFFAPLPLLSMVVLAVNDHVLKARFHNALTGKLSDVAGCFALPLFIAALLAGWLAPARRALVGAVVTVLLFGAIKSSQAASDALMDALTPLAHALGLGARLHVIADPSDLVALVMVPLALAWARRRACTLGDERSRQVPPSSEHRRADDPRRPASR
ncbi:MAG: hypothetical protein MUC96_16905 [Myxococcaceae bacterium]|nr:hypothetical protein [Myxococcaceae bacterium]